MYLVRIFRCRSRHNSAILVLFITLFVVYFVVQYGTSVQSTEKKSALFPIRKSVDEPSVIDETNSQLAYPVGENCPKSPFLSAVQKRTYSLPELFDQLNFSEPLNHDFYYNESGSYQDSTHRLRVILAPFSHTDPAWLWSFDNYYNARVRPMLSTTVEFLSRHREIKFIWSEIVFLARWFHEATSNERSLMRGLVRSGQLEILTGGWVSPDEASTSLFGLLNQYAVGNKWLHDQLNVKVLTTYSLDPFGYSSTVPYLLAKMGYKRSVMVRVHGRLKQFFRAEQALDFRWFPIWDGSSAYPLNVHLFPYKVRIVLELAGRRKGTSLTSGQDRWARAASPVVSVLSSPIVPQLYNHEHDCGPITHKCKMIDFWMEPLDRADKKTVKMFAATLNRQLRLMARSFQPPIVLYPFGDDFRFIETAEWENMLNAFAALRPVLKKEFNIELTYGTVNDYFNAIESWYSQNAAKGHAMPTLSGDFFPYMDVENWYWTGYFSTRVQLKVMLRRAERTLQFAETLFGLRLLSGQRLDRVPAEQLSAGCFPKATTFNFEQSSNRRSNDTIFVRLENARRLVAFMQHHDSITGTSPQSTIALYSEYLHEALNTTECFLSQPLSNSSGPALLEVSRSPRFDWAQKALYAVTGKSDEFAQGRTPFFRMDWEKTLSLNSAFLVVNSYEQRRRSLVHVALSVGVQLAMKPSAFASTVSLFTRRALPSANSGPANEPWLPVADTLLQFSRPYHIRVSGVTYDDHTESAGILIVSFYVELDAFGSKTLSIRPNQARLHNGNSLETVRCGQLGGIFVPAWPLRTVSIIVDPKSESEKELNRSGHLKNAHLSASFSPQLQQLSVDLHNGRRSHFDVDVGVYAFQPQGSGAYIFKPEQGAPKQHELLAAVQIDGLLHSSFVLTYRNCTVVIRLCSECHWFDVEVFSYSILLKQSEQEMVLRSAVNWHNSAGKSETRWNWYTDSNCHMFARRIWTDALGTAGNFYPAACMAMVTAPGSRFSERFTVLMQQPVGVSSLGASSLDVMFERRTRYDDGRGISEGVLDNEPVQLKFIWLFESVDGPAPSDDAEPTGAIPYPSLDAFVLLQRLTKPVYGSQRPTWPYGTFADGVLLPLDVSLLHMRPLTRDDNSKVGQVGLTLYRTAFDCRFASKFPSNGQEAGRDFNLSTVFGKSSAATQLSHFSASHASPIFFSESTFDFNGSVGVSPNQLRTFLISIK